MRSRQAARERVDALCRGLPEVTAEGDRHVGFSVRGRRFAWLLEDHHGDGRLSVSCKVVSGENTSVVESDPDRYFIPSYLGSRGWVGAWLDIDRVDWDRVEALVVDSYRLTAPRRLAARLGDPPDAGPPA